MQVWKTRVEGSWGKERPWIEWEEHIRSWWGEKGRPCRKRLDWRRTRRRSGTGWCNPAPEREKRGGKKKESGGLSARHHCIFQSFVLTSHRKWGNSQKSVRRRYSTGIWTWYLTNVIKMPCCCKQAISNTVW